MTARTCTPGLPAGKGHKHIMCRYFLEGPVVQSNSVAPMDDDFRKKVSWIDSSVLSKRIFVPDPRLSGKGHVTKDD